MMHKNIIKKVSLAGVLALGVLVMAPTTSTAADPTMATLHVVVNVINNDGGTAVPSDFTLHIRYLMHEITGSPFTGESGAGTTFVLTPGSYLVTDNDVPVSDGYVTYYGNYSGGGDNNGFVTLAAGQEMTLVRTENDWPVAGAAVVQPTPSPVPTTPVVTPTETGGQLPTTSTPWYNLLAVAFGLVLLGGLGLKTRKVTK